jgi:hypothetical protein
LGGEEFAGGHAAAAGGLDVEQTQGTLTCGHQEIIAAG